MHAIVSIHDVMPATLSRVNDIINRLPATCQVGLVLLIVPGKDWAPGDIDWLRGCVDQGIELAGHGWSHSTRDIQGFYHRAHSLLISRTAAEHLSLTADEIEQLMQANFAWFRHQGLPEPALYVPPAWAMGSISADRLAAMPFQYYETTSGIVKASTGRQVLLPLVGFEADTRLRQLLLTTNNRLNAMLASPKRPLRISIHPYDQEYRLTDALMQYCRAVTVHRRYRSVFPQ